MIKLFAILAFIAFCKQADPLDPSDDLDCSQDNILIAGQTDPVGYPGGQCAFVKEVDDCQPQGNFNFLKMYYCDFESWFGSTGKLVAFVPIGCLIMYVLMYNLASTADDYLSPSLEYMTIKFKLAESLAGVTLLAFGNGAPDIFAAIAAASAGSDDNDASQQTENALQAISQLVGGAVFISSIVMLLTTCATKPTRSIQMTPLYFTRDLVFYSLALLYLLGIMLVVKEINIYIALGFFVIYFIYVALVVVQSKSPESEQQKKTNQEALDLVDSMQEGARSHHTANSARLNNNTEQQFVENTSPKDDHERDSLSPSNYKIGDLSSRYTSDTKFSRKTVSSIISEDHIDILIKRRSTFLEK